MSRIEKLERHQTQLDTYLRNLKAGLMLTALRLSGFKKLINSVKADGFTLKELILTPEAFDILDEHGIVDAIPELQSLRKRFEQLGEFTDYEGTQSSLQILKLKIDPGTAPPEEIAKYLHLLDKLYKARGGSGLEFKPEYVGIKEREGVTS